MNIAIINTLAKTKSTGKIAYGLYSYLREKGKNVTLYYGRKDEVEQSESILRFETDLGNYIHVAFSRLFGDQGLHSKIATRKMIKEMKKRRTEVVYLLNIHGYYLNFPLLFDYFRESKIKIIYIMVDESAFRAKCCATNPCTKYQKECCFCPEVKNYPKSLMFDKSKKIFLKKELAYKGNDITFVGINYTVECAKKATLTKGFKFDVIDEAVNTKDYYFPCGNGVLDDYSIDKERIVIMGLGPYSNYTKGGRFFMQTAKMFENDEKYIFIYAGFDGKREKCPENVLLLSYINDIKEMARWYSAADLFVCTSYAETISNTCLEALACGTGIMVFDACGMPDCAKDGQGFVVPVGDVPAMVKVISKVKKKTKEDIDFHRNYAVERYDSRTYFKRLVELL